MKLRVEIDAEKDPARIKKLEDMIAGGWPEQVRKVLTVVLSESWISRKDR